MYLLRVKQKAHGYTLPAFDWISTVDPAKNVW